MISHHGIVLYCTVYGNRFITPYRLMLHDCYSVKLCIYILIYFNIELDRSKVTYVTIKMYNR